MIVEIKDFAYEGRRLIEAAGYGDGQVFSDISELQVATIVSKLFGAGLNVMLCHNKTGESEESIFLFVDTRRFSQR